MKSIYKTGSVEDILKEAEAELKNCKFIAYCADDKRFDEISSGLRRTLPNTSSIGTTGFMFNQNGSFAEGFSAIGFMENEVEVYVGTLRKTDTCPIKYLPGFLWSVDMIQKSYKNNVCLEFCTDNEEKVVSTLKISLESAGMRLIGGTAGNTLPEHSKRVACNGKVLSHAAVYAIIGSKMGKINVCKENLYKANDQEHVVTKVSDDFRTIYEIDGRKAIDVYKEELGYTDATLEKGVFENPLCRIVGSENYITAIYSFNPDRSITTYKNIQKNDMIAFMTINEDWKNFIADNMREFISGGRVAGLISINCILRYLLFENNRYTSEYAALLHDLANGAHLGLVSDGEQYIEQHVNQTMVGIAFMKD